MRATKRTAILSASFAVLFMFVLLKAGENKAPAGSASSGLYAPRAGEAIAAQPSASADAVSHALVLRERPGLGEPKGVLFGSQLRDLPAAKAAVAAPVAPSAPPLPYRFAGKMVGNGAQQVFLAKGNVAIPITRGQIIDGAYRVKAIEDDHVKLVYLPLNHEESVAFRYSNVVVPTRSASVTNTNRDENQLISAFGRWTQLSREERRQISEYLAQLPPSPARDRLQQEYRRQVWGLKQ